MRRLGRTDGHLLSWKHMIYIYIYLASLSHYRRMQTHRGPSKRSARHRFHKRFIYIYIYIDLDLPKNENAWIYKCSVSSVLSFVWYRIQTPGGNIYHSNDDISIYIYIYLYLSIYLYICHRCCGGSSGSYGSEVHSLAFAYNRTFSHTQDSRRQGLEIIAAPNEMSDAIDICTHVDRSIYIYSIDRYLSIFLDLATVSIVAVWPLWCQYDTHVDIVRVLPRKNS